jgi:hypothetical protein
MAGGGFGEAALMSAVVGGGVSAIKGEDPLKGALLGGLLGGATGGIGNLLSPAATTAATAGLAAPVAETAVLGSAASPFATQAANQAAQTAVAATSAPALAAEQLALGQAAVPSITANAQQAALVKAASQIPKEAVTSPGGLESLFNKFNTLSTPEKILYGSSAALAAPTVMSLFKDKKELGGGKEEYSGPLKKFKYDPNRYVPLEVTPPTPYRPVYTDYQNYASGGDVDSYAFGGRTAGVGPMGPTLFANRAVNNRAPKSLPVFNVPAAQAPVAAPTPYKARYAQGGISDLGGYSDYAGGGRMLKGPGDGMSDNIPATIAGKQPARLANEEFVIPADVVSHLGNGSSEAGAKQLYKMMDRVRQARTGKKKQGKQINPEKYLA